MVSTQPGMETMPLVTPSLAMASIAPSAAQPLAAAVQGIEALRRGDVDVRSLQDWAASKR